jgi:hypothetical protein
MLFEFDVEIHTSHITQNSLIQNPLNFFFAVIMSGVIVWKRLRMRFSLILSHIIMSPLLKWTPLRMLIFFPMGLSIFTNWIILVIGNLKIWGSFLFTFANQQNEIERLFRFFCSLNYTLAVNTNVIVRYHRPNNFTRLDIHLPNFLNSSLLNNSNTIDIQRRLLIINEGRFQLQSMINRAFTSYTLKLHNVSEGTILFPLLNIRFVQRMPYFANADLLIILE